MSAEALSSEQFGSWADVEAQHPAYSQRSSGYYDAVNELAHDGEPGHELSFTSESVHPRSVRFQRYPASDERVSSALEGYRSGAQVPPVLVVSRAGERMTADGHHRLSAAEILGRPVPGLVANSPREDRYAGRAKIGTLRKPRTP